MLATCIYIVSDAHVLQRKYNPPSTEAIKAINLKRGQLVLCGPPGQQFGEVKFETSCSGSTQKEVNLAISLLHSFEYEEAEKVFASVIDKAPGCAMAYWGVAMCNYHPLWSPPLPAEMEKGAKAIAIAQSLTGKTAREPAYIEAMALFYKNSHTTAHRTRAIHFEKAMEKLYASYPEDKEAAIFYALSLAASASPADTGYANQRKAGKILTSLYPSEPNHPGIVHYLIHSYDYPALASMALPAAKQYAAIAPSSAHAQHMPSHIFTRLGLWEQCIQSNLVATDAAKCYAENNNLPGHWDEELHSLDYLVYAYLQQGDNNKAKAQWDYLKTITAVSPVNFKVAYAFAAIPARYLLENKQWQQAANLSLHPQQFPWEQYPWQKTLFHYTRLLGAVHMGDIACATKELQQLTIIHNSLTIQQDGYKANQVDIQVTTGRAWLLLKTGKENEALPLMMHAAAMEDKTEKHPVTPGEVIPARELLGDMLLEMKEPALALEAYEKNLQKNLNRLNSLYGAAVASERSYQPAKAKNYYHQLLSSANALNSSRPEIAASKLFVRKMP